MKRNVDLTENLMFHSPGVGNNMAADDRDLLLELVSNQSKAPWNWELGTEISADTLLSKKEEPLVFTGNKEDRAHKKHVMRWETGKYCDCCGRLISKKPWEIKYSLCNKCDERFEEKPWIIQA